MNDDLMRTYEQTLAKINENHASAVRSTRYNPWRLGVYVSLALAALPAALVIGHQVQGQLGAVIGLALALPIPFFVILYAYDGVQVEHQRMVAERNLLVYGPVLPESPVVSTGGNSPASEPLRPGLVQDGQVVARAPQLSREKVFLKNACLKLCRAGKERGSWARSALAEGSDAMMSGEEWDAASPWLQANGYFMVKAGRGGGLMPVPGKDVDETIRLLEVAQ